MQLITHIEKKMLGIASLILLMHFIAALNFNLRQTTMLDWIEAVQHSSDSSKALSCRPQQPSADSIHFVVIMRGMTGSGCSAQTRGSEWGDRVIVIKNGVFIKKDNL